MVYDNLKLNSIKSQSEASGSKLSLWGAGGKIQKLYYPADVREMIILISSLQEYYLIGKGSNLLIADEGYRGNVISTALLKDVVVHDNNLLYCGAGIAIARLARFAYDRSLSGVEELSGIPGSIGGAVVGNAGAYGRDIGELVKYVDLCRYDKIERIGVEDIQFSYRNSSLRNSVIVGVGLSLVESCRELIGKNIQYYRNKRIVSQPQERSLGSVFKAYKGKPAAQYIEELELKGYTIGDAMISPKHCNFIINRGKATTNDYIKLARLIKDRIYERFGVLLETELIYLGAINEDFRRLSYAHSL